MEAASLREISAVCTHPDLQGRGLARRLMHLLIRRQRRRGLVPFLHVMQYNTRAIAMYERMGFRRHRQWVLRVVCRT
jgi:ribosomal protein S18 acetylase RimI-like enzyme